MNITKQEFELFEQWKHSRSGFVFDGVVSECDYIKSNIKLCFVLKEVNDEGGGDWDLREFIQQGARPQTWDNITRWVKCIRSSSGEIKWSDLENITKEDRTEVLKSICAMNMKKSPGGHTTERASFNMALNEDKSFIQSQYDIYDPEITVCCGTGWDLRWALNLNESEVFETSRGVRWFKNKNNNPVIIYAHPAARVHPSLLVYGLVDALREILNSH
ncbi:hypothetical protein ACTG24_10875 [Aeromonas veronii]